MRWSRHAGMEVNFAFLFLASVKKPFLVLVPSPPLRVLFPREGFCRFWVGIWVCGKDASNWKEGERGRQKVLIPFPPLVA